MSSAASWTCRLHEQQLSSQVRERTVLWPLSRPLQEAKGSAIHRLFWNFQICIRVCSLKKNMRCEIRKKKKVGEKYFIDDISLLLSVWRWYKVSRHLSSCRLPPSQRSIKFSSGARELSRLHTADCVQSSPSLEHCHPNLPHLILFSVVLHVVHLQIRKYCFCLERQTSPLQSPGSRYKIHHHYRTRHLCQNLHFFFLLLLCRSNFWLFFCPSVFHLWSRQNIIIFIFFAILAEWNTSTG